MKNERFLLLTTLFLFLFGMSGFGQRDITGTVVDQETGEELVGASVLVKGATGVGAITDYNGNFGFRVPEGYNTLVVTYTGYERLEYVLGAGNSFQIGLPKGSRLDEVVVVGYGEVRRSDLTGSVASLKEKDFNQGVIVSADQLLQARVPGVNIVNNSGQPGGQTTVQIRGNNSIRAGANPLYVIDGFPLDGRTAQAAVAGNDLGNIARSNPLNFINPADIESIEVLKDASAAAIYGSRAANGVILVTLKKGRKNQPTVNFNTSVGTSSILKRYDVLNGDQYRKALSDYNLTGGDGGASIDPFNEILRRGFVQNYGISFGSSSENSSVRASFGYNDINGIVKESGLKRYNAAFNGNFTFLDKRAGVDILMIANQTRESIAPISTNPGFTGNLVAQALQWNPTIPLVDGNGAFVTNANNPTNATIGATTINPLQLLAAHNENATTNNVLLNISPYYRITNKLTYRYRLGVGYGTGITRSNISGDVNVQGIQGLGWASIGNAELLNTLHSHTLNFNDYLTERISFGALVGYEYQKFDYKGYALNGLGFTLQDFDNTNAIQNSLNSNKRFFSFADPISEIQSFFGRVNVGIDNKYLFTGTVRADGSTKFGANNKYGVFPSAAFAWRISNENFMSGNTLFDDLKFRVGVGVTGNQEFPAGAALDRFALLEDNSSAQINVGNPDLRWESSTTYNVGVDFSILDYRLTGTVEYFRRNTNDLLLDPFVSEPGPQVRAWRNLDATVLNSGVELGLWALLMERGKSRLNMGVNATFLKNEFRNPNGADILTGNLFGQGASGAFIQRMSDGLPLNTFFLKDHIGLDDNGISQFANDEALIAAGDPNPRTLLGLSLGYEYDRFSFVTNFNGAFGHKIYNNTAMTVIPIGNLGNRNIDANLIGGPVRESLANPITSSTRYLERGDFFKLANATMAYRIGDFGVFRNAVVSLTGQNLFVITKYSGFDPEVNTVNLRDGVPSSGIEYIPYPSARSFLLGLNVSF